MARPSTADQRRAQILVAFVDELAAQGYDATSMARLGKATGLRPSLMHYYFPSKHHIMLASIPHLEAIFVARRDRYNARAGTAPERLHALIDAHLAVDGSTKASHVAAWIQLLSLAQLDKDIGAAVGALLRTRHQELHDAIHAARPHGDAVMTASGILAAIIGMFQLSRLTPDLIRSGGAAALVKQQLAALLQ